MRNILILGAFIQYMLIPGGSCTGHQSGSRVSDTLTIVSFNLYGAPDSEWSRRLTMILDELELLRPDLIALQEAVQTSSSGGSDNRAKALADSLSERTGYGYTCIFERTHTGWGIYDEGVAVLTRHLVLDTDVLALPPGLFTRKVLWVRTLTASGIVNFYTTHLSYGNQEEERISQVRAIREFIERKQTDSIAVADILCSDFNTIPGSPPIQLLVAPDSSGLKFRDSWAEINPGIPGYTIPSNNPSSRIDYVFAGSGEQTRIHGCNLVLDQPDSVGIYPSDHIGVVSRLETAIHKLNMSILSPSPKSEVSGETLISWSAGAPTDSLRYKLYISDDAGRSWKELWDGWKSTPSWLWNSGLFPDGTRFLIRVAAVGDTSFGMTQSAAPFTVNNPGMPLRKWN